MTGEAIAPQRRADNLKDFLLPDLGEGLTEAELVRWLVEVGQEVLVDQPVAEVETAKSVVEVPSPYAGTVRVLHGSPGETIDVGTPLVSVQPAADLDAAGEAYRAEERAGVTEGSGNVLIGYGTSTAPAGGRRRAKAGSDAAVGDNRRGEAGAAAGQAPQCISPLVRRMARDANIRLADLGGSGSNGMVLRRDVAFAAAAGAPGEPAPTAAATAGPPAESGRDDPRTGLGVTRRTPVRGMRKATAENLARSRREIPEATVWVDVDATALVELRRDLHCSGPDTGPGLLALLARFVLAGLARYPELNTRIEPAADGGQEILGFDGVNLGVAVQTERGLVVPSVRRADRLSARELDAEIRRLTGVVREGKAAELVCGTFTLNNYGIFGIDGSAAIINHPEVAILGVGRIIDRPWVVAGELAVRKVTELTLTFDHRVCDGQTAAGFLRYVADAVEKPGSVLADL